MPQDILIEEAFQKWLIVVTEGQDPITLKRSFIAGHNFQKVESSESSLNVDTDVVETPPIPSAPLPLWVTMNKSNQPAPIYTYTYHLEKLGLEFHDVTVSKFTKPITTETSMLERWALFPWDIKLYRTNVNDDGKTSSVTYFLNLTFPQNRNIMNNKSDQWSMDRLIYNLNEPFVSVNDYGKSVDLARKKVLIFMEEVLNL